MLNLKALLTKLTTALSAAASISSGTPAITITKGTITEANYRKYGPIIQISWVVKNSSQVNAGDDIATGTITTSAVLPISKVMGSNYYGLRPIVSVIRTDGTFVVRNAANSNLSANSATRSNLIYIAKNWQP